MKFYTLIIFLIVFLAVGCEKKHSNSVENNSSDTIESISKNSKKQKSHQIQKSSVKKLKPPIKNPVYYCETGKCVKIEKSEALQKGLSLIDLSNKFVPFVFSEQDSEDATRLHNNYRQTFINLENDITDESGRKLKQDEHNYLEVYGIPPTLSVLQKRFLKDDNGCALKINTKIFKELKINLVWNPDRPKKYLRRLKYAEKKLRKRLRKLRINKTLDEYVKTTKDHSGTFKRYIRNKKIYDTFVSLQQRLVCEGLLKGKYKEGFFDKKTYLALKLFEKKHRIFNWGVIDKKVKKFLTSSMLENDFKTLRRVLYERVAHSLAIFEDGSIPKSMWNGKAENRNLIGRFTNILMKKLKINTPNKALQFFKNHKSSFFDDFYVAIKLPPLPKYYSSNMDFFVKTTIGDVWYDVPYTADGKRKSQPLKVLPRLYFYVIYKGRKIPLTRLGTTAGGWQKEYFKKQVFLKYKASDLGFKEWKFLVGGPVWFPPASTPPKELITYVRKNGRIKATPKYKVFGPSYASAYGLAMALHTFSRRKRDGTIEDLDRGIRSHGSVNYMSIRASHSHGCHRLRNHLAVRLFSSILKRHKYKRLGQVKTKWTHFIYYTKKVFKINLKTKGYYFELTPPIKIRVTRNNILGRVKQPIKDLIRIPGVKYPPDLNVGLEIQPDGSLQPFSSSDASEVPPEGNDMVPSAVPDATSLNKTINNQKTNNTTKKVKSNKLTNKTSLKTKIPLKSTKSPPKNNLKK